MRYFRFLILSSKSSVWFPNRKSYYAVPLPHRVRGDHNESDRYRHARFKGLDIIVVISIMHYFILYFIPVFKIFLLSFSARSSRSQSRRQELNRDGVASLSLCLLILTRVPFTVKNHKESSLRATTSPSPQLSLEPQNGYVTEAWELILSRCLQSEQDQKVETEMTKHLIRSWWNQDPRVGSAISETQRPCLFRGTSKPL